MSENIPAATGQAADNAQKSDPRKFDIVINRRSGTVLKTGEAGIESGLREGFGDQCGEIMMIDGKDIAATVRDWVAKNAGSGRGLVIGGGDGTVLTAAGEVLGREDIALGVLPLGTHNLFARQLGFAADFKKAAAQYKNSAPASVDVGQVNGKNFLVGLMIDRNSVEFYQAREDFRDKKYFRGLRKIFSMAAGVIGGRKLKLDVDGKLHTGRIFIVTNNMLSPKPSPKPAPFALPSSETLKPVIENALAKGAQDDGRLALYAFKGGAHNVASLTAAITDGSWTQHKSVTVTSGQALSITPSGKDKAGKQAELPIILDGEETKTTYPLEVKIVPKGLRVFRPGG
ncbi:MAG: hypothetical protein GC185_10825 [Alphaproteobacteria bacterium]|nr:hypothetical protein [Alphaproteobacteria bacterium]